MTYSMCEKGLLCSLCHASVDMACDEPPSLSSPLPGTCSCCWAQMTVPRGGQLSVPRVSLLGLPVGAGPSSAHSAILLIFLLLRATLGREKTTEPAQGRGRARGLHCRPVPADCPAMQPLGQGQVPYVPGWCPALGDRSWAFSQSLWPALG